MAEIDEKNKGKDRRHPFIDTGIILYLFKSVTVRL